DITGFGLAGHSLEMARGSKVRIELRYRDIPFMSGARAMYERGMSTGSNVSNRALSEPDMDIRASLQPAQTELLFDPQTNGGLLLAVDASVVEALVRDLRAAGVADAACIGHAVASGDGTHLVID
ncbi:MAG: hypothetical protein KDI31_09410, partial [Pseudomonadales bacterium]|nr:hypothetical protein [Pseudomonadales bacterium]